MTRTKPLQLFTFFHLNLAFSSIEEEQRAEVIRRCYWPLLQLISTHQLPAGIEVSGYTLEAIAAIDPGWISKLKELCSCGTVEFIGSGYAQLIGPLVPAEVNRANQRIGIQVYQKLLGFRPHLALVNEQAYAAGLIDHYREAGYDSLIMEWDNPARFSPEWRPQWRYLPQIAVGPSGQEMPIIWNNSIFFQQFQRYVHGELELPAYLEMLERQDPGQVGAIPLYGNDVEIFDFRPGRFTTEALIEHDEWRRIGQLIEHLKAAGRFTFILPSAVLSCLNLDGGGNLVRLESPQSPIPVKKQEKYNVTRWAVTGRNDTRINTSCQQIYRRMVDGDSNNDQEWKELCYLWSSDFRTHITAKRWRRYLRRLAAFAKKLTVEEPVSFLRGGKNELPDTIQVCRKGKYLQIDAAEMKIRLNLRRGLAVDSLIFPRISEQSLCGTLYHGYFDDITSGADFYTGHFVFETPGRPKITDLMPVEPVVRWHQPQNVLTVTASVDTPLGKVEKQLVIDPLKGEVVIDYLFHWATIPVGSLRLGHVTVNPEAFDRSSLYYCCHNGGSQVETFSLSGVPVCHGDPSSFLVSAKQGLGITEGCLELGDAQKKLRLKVDRTVASVLGLITFKEVADSYFCRCSFSASEMDETSKAKRFASPFRVKVAISAA